MKTSILFLIAATLVPLQSIGNAKVLPYPQNGANSETDFVQNVNPDVHAMVRPQEHKAVLPLQTLIFPSSTTKEAVEKVNVKFHVDFDEADYQFINLVSYINGDVRGYVYPEDIFNPDVKDVEASIPPGTYDFCVELWRYDSDGGGIAKIFKELVTVEEGSQINFDASDITRHIEVTSKNIEGETCVIPTKRYIDHDPWIETVDPGNVNNILCYQFYVNDEWGITTALSGSADYINESSGVNGERQFDFYFNELSDRYRLVEMRLIPFNDGFLMIKYDTKNFNATQLVNNPALFIPYKEEIISTPGSRNFEKGDVPSYIYWQVLANHYSPQLLMSGNCAQEIPNLYIDCPIDNSDIAINALISVAKNDICTEISTEDGGVYEYTARTIGIPVIQQGDHLEFANVGHQDTSNATLRIPADLPTPVLTWNPAFSYNTQYKNGIIGNSSPILSVLDTSNEAEGMISKSSELYYIGRFGEVRQSDTFLAKGSLEYNGDKVASTYDEIIEWESKSHTPGRLNYTFRNDNILIDGKIQGYNQAQVSIDETTGDIYAPTLQMLQTRQGDYITDRFDNIDDAVIEFCGGDFHYTVDELYYNLRTYLHQWYDCEKITAKIEFSESGKSDFKEIPLTMVSELDMPAGFGYFYRAILKDVKDKLGNGWFDIRVSLTDKNGNTQNQVISPAFNVSGISSVKNISVESTPLLIKDNCIYAESAVRMALYNPTGILINEVAGDSMPISNCSSGIYFVKAYTLNGETTQKILIK